jgi:hypothetical protein
MILLMMPDVTENYLVFRSSFFENQRIRYLFEEALKVKHDQRCTPPRQRLTWRS